MDWYRATSIMDHMSFDSSTPRVSFPFGKRAATTNAPIYETSMRNNVGLALQCRPRFDCLESRALLSGGNLGPTVPGPMFGPPPHAAPAYSEPLSFNASASIDRLGLPTGWTEPPHESWEPPPSEPSPSGLGVQIAAELAAAAQPGADNESPPAAAGTSTYSGAIGSPVSAFLSIQARVAVAPSGANSSGIATVSAAVAPDFVQRP